MLERGYSAVTYRSVAATAGVTAGLVQYYFPTLDELFLALLRRRSERNHELLLEALESRRTSRCGSCGSSTPTRPRPR